MKVLDLSCVQGHVFEGWFTSEADYQAQTSSGFLQCPMCGSAEIRKKLSAPRLNSKSNQHSEVLRSAAEPTTTHESEAAAPLPALPSDSQRPAQAAPLPAQVQAAWMQMARKIIANTEDVGPQFAQEARRMHEGDATQRPIRGQATPEETAELLEEGIPVLSMMLPETAKETLQ